MFCWHVWILQLIVTCQYFLGPPVPATLTVAVESILPSHNYQHQPSLLLVQRLLPVLLCQSTTILVIILLIVRFLCLSILGLSFASNFWDLHYHLYRGNPRVRVLGQAQLPALLLRAQGSVVLLLAQVLLALLLAQVLPILLLAEVLPLQRLPNLEQDSFTRV